MNKYSQEQQKDNGEGRVTGMQNATDNCLHGHVRILYGQQEWPVGKSNLKSITITA